MTQTCLPAKAVAHEYIFAQQFPGGLDDDRYGGFLSGLGSVVASGRSGAGGLTCLGQSDLEATSPKWHLNDGLVTRKM